MKKLLAWLDRNGLKALVIALIIFIPLYPKLPTIHIVRTWVYIRLEDFLIALSVFTWLLQLLRRKVSLSFQFGLPIALYWGAGLLSLVISLIFIAPSLANFFPHLALLAYARRIEYMILFFVGVSTIKSRRDLRDILLALSFAVFGVVLYGLGQKVYIYAWQAFPDFFKQNPFCFPSFQTGNEEFAKGIPLCLPEGARITSTFGGHYDLAAYLVFVIPVLGAVALAIKNKILKVLMGLLWVGSLMVLIFTASRVSFAAYLLGMIMMLTFFKRKKYIIPVIIFSIVVLATFSGSTAKRFLETVRFTSIVTNNQGQIVGQAALPSELQKRLSKDVLEQPPVNESLPAGSGFITLPQTRAPTATNSAFVSTSLSPEEARRLQLERGGVEISTVSGSFLIQKALVYDISFTTRFQSEWPNAMRAFLRNPLTGSGYSTITLATDGDYFRFLGETGILGILSFLFIFVIYGIALRQILSSVPTLLEKAYVVGLAGGVLGIFFNAIFIDVFEASKVAETMWVLLGLGGGILLLCQKAEIKYLYFLKRFFTSNTLIITYYIILGISVFIPLMGHFFTADDFTWLHWAASSTLSSIKDYFLDATGFFYRPLPKTLMYFMYTFFSFQPMGYRVVTLLLHLTTTVGVFLLVRLITRNKLIAFGAGLVFLLLPANGENLFWISVISTTLAGFFIIYGLYFFINARTSNSVFFYILSVIFAFGAAFSYEVGIVFPLLALLVDLILIPVIKDSKKINFTKTKLFSYLPYILIIGAYLVLRSLSHAAGFSGDYNYNPAKFLVNGVGNYFGYLLLFIYGLSSFPLYTSLREQLRVYPLEISGVIVVTLVILIALAWKNKKILKMAKTNFAKVIIFSLLFSFISLLPFLGLGNITPRYGYVASFGFSLLASYLIYYIVNNTDLRKYMVRMIFFVLIVCILGVYYVQMASQSREWNTAGKITQNTLGIFRVDHEDISSYATIIFANVPIKKGNAWIFPVGLSDGLWFIYRDDTIKVVQVGSVSDAAKIPTQPGGKNYVFQFDNNGQVSEVK